MERVVFITEPLLSEEFVQHRFVAPLAAWLTQRFDVSVVSPAIAPEVQRRLEDSGVQAISGGAWFPDLRHPRDEVPSYVTSWTRDAFFQLNARRMEEILQHVPGLRINLSMTSACRSDVWFVQGRPLGPSLREIAPSLRRSLRAVVASLGPMAAWVDERHMQFAAQRSRSVLANSKFLQAWFQEHGITVSGVLPSFFISDFSPTTNNPRRDYALVYLGKETEVTTVREMVRAGMPVKVFGAKSSGLLRGADLGGNRPNLSSVGRVSHDELRELYTNALFTAFPFTEEPFGAVPVESMACGTPVLTYRKQGPGETVLDGTTGWLVETPSEFQATARRIFSDHYPETWAMAALERAREFRLDRIASRWGFAIRETLTDRTSELRARLRSRLPSSSALLQMS